MLVLLTPEDLAQVNARMNSHAAQLTILHSSFEQAAQEIMALADRLDALEEDEGEVPLPPPDPDPMPDPEPNPDPEPLPVDVLIDRPFLTQEQIEEFHWVNSMVYPAGDPRAGRYDADIDGAILPITKGESMPSLRRHNSEYRVPAPVSGQVFVSWEFLLPQSHYDLPWESMTWDTMKTFRVFNDAKRQTTQDTAATMNLLMPKPGNTPRMALREVGLIKGTEKDHDIRIDWYPPADKWINVFVVFDYDEEEIHVRLTDAFTDEVFWDSVTGVSGMKPIDNLAPLLHSTSRSHTDGDDGSTHDTYIAYRNVLMGVL